MSTQTSTDNDVVEVPPPSHFAERADAGDETWLEDAIQAYLDLRLGPKQREICRSVVSNERTAVIGANGTGKTYITAAIVLAWQTVRYPAISFGTSGTGKKLYRTLCRPIDKLHGAAVGGAGLPGTFKRQPPRIDYDDPEHYFEAATPSDAGELEGAHATYTLAIIEEADKDDVTAETIDSMRSLIPDYDTGRMLAVGNPPEDESDVFASIVATDSAWNVVHVSSFDSWNVQVETGVVADDSAETIDGMATVSALREDWKDYHDEKWPGVEQAWQWTDPWHGTDASGAIVPHNGAPNPEFRDDLDERWYRRRGGIIPPSGAETWRPFHPPTVKRVFDDTAPAAKGGRPIGSGLDVARSGDKTVLITAYPNRLVVRDTWEGTNYPQQEADIMEVLDRDPTHPLAVDATGEGSGLADYLADRWPETYRFRADGKPPLSDGDRTTDTDYGATNYRSQRAEGLAVLGDWLEDASVGAVTDRDLRTELLAGARTVSFSERHLASRGEDGEDVVEVNSKDAVKQYLDHSPDYLDASTLAAWAAECAPEKITSDNAIVF